jgi:asparagine synthase (glutamine-hydrolysing)
MCGILAASGLPVFHHRHLASLRRRGPDAVGYWTSPEVSLGHARLSIIGLDERGTQPMENHRHVLAFNGEIYNFEEIRAKLLSCGVPCKSGTDTEVVLNAWTKWGAEMLTRLTGFWAFVIYDKEQRTLTLVRDQLGVKPMYYWHTRERTVASSLLRTVVETAGETPQLDYSAISEYVLYQLTFGDKTFFQPIKKVLPGHLVEINLATGDLTTRCFEDIINPTDGAAEKLTAECIQRTKDLIVECCRDSTISDTSFTTFCSGGLDSSLITAIVRPSVAYHCNYSDPECNETFFAKAVINHIHAQGGDTRLMTVNAQEDFSVPERVADILEDFDELTVGSVIFPLDDLLRRVKARYKVILTGTGGDELFGGYVRYQLAMGECYQDSYRMLFEKMSAIPGVAARFEMTHSKGSPSLYKFYDPRAETTFQTAFEECRPPSGCDLSAMLMFDRRYFLAALLNIDDKMCGRHSLESRPSLLHQKLVRHVVRIRPQDLMCDHELKYLLRISAVDHLPATVLRRTDKMGFTTPIGDFINRNAHLIREQVMESRFRHLYDLPALVFHADNKFSREAFGLLMLDTWLNRYARPIN